MKFFQRLFNKPETNNSKRIDSPKYNRVIKATNYIYLNTVFVDDEAFFSDQKAMVIDVVPDSDYKKQTFHNANKLCYQHLNFISNLSHDDFIKISGVLNISAEKYEERFTLWPSEISNETYEKLYSILKIDFVKEDIIPGSNQEIYVISINEDFYLRSNWRHFKYCGLDTTEREFFPEEFIHDNFLDAIRYACIITNRLWAGAPDNAQFFKLRLQNEIEGSLLTSLHKEQLQLFNKFLDTYNFSGLGWEYVNHINYGNRNMPREQIIDLVKQEYDRLWEKYKLEIDLLKHVSAFIDNPPFFINKVSRTKT